MENANSKIKWVEALIYVLLCAGFYGLYANAHYVNDDHYFLLPFYDYKINGGELAVIDVFRWMWEQINLNFRASNHITIIMLLMPHWIADVLSVLMIVLMFRSAMNLVGTKRIMSQSACVMILLLVMVLPWFDQMFNVAFRINYIWASAIVLLFLNQFLSYRTDFSTIKKIGLILLAILASMMHEGSSVPLCIGIIAQYILSKKRMYRAQVVMLSIFIVGALFLVFTPGINARIESVLQWRSMKSYILYLCGYNMPTLIFMLIVIYALIKGYYQKMVEHNLPIYFVAAIVGCGIFMVSPVIRASWYPTLFSIIGVIILLKDVFVVNIRKTQILIYSVYIVVISHLFVSCYYSNIIYKEWSAIASKYEEAVDSNFYTPITLEKELPLITLGKAYGFRHQIWGNNIMSLMATFYKVDKDILAIPEDLRNIEKRDLVKIKGDNPFYWYGDYIIMPQNENCVTMYSVKIKPVELFNVNLYTRAKMMYIDFVTDSGDCYYLVAANYQALQPIFDNVEEINK